MKLTRIPTARIVHQRRFIALAAVLLLCVLMPARLRAHGGVGQSPDGITPPAPPVLPTPAAGQTLFRIDPDQS